MAHDDYPEFHVPDPISTAPTPAECGTDTFAVAAVALFAGLPKTSVTYRRGADAVALCAVLGRKRLLIADELGGSRIEYSDCDFIVRAADLVLGGGPVRPRRGDVIEHDDGEDIHTYEVAPVGDEPHFRWCDPHRRLIRVHTKRLKQEPA